ncbi:MAG: T9SS type A sorting domain-containing protein [Bacteroidetes bacterium]|nr:T9SS type A sorting domain-containing protein [Bacteroidota bacterium]
MKIKLLCFFFVSVFYAYNQFACAQLTFHKTYGTNLQENSVLGADHTYDGGYITLTWTIASSSDINNYLVKTDQSGNLMWTKTLDATDNLLGRAIKQTSYNGFIIVGDIVPTGSNIPEAHLIKTDSVGVPLWSKQLPSPNGSIAHDVVALANGEIVVTGVFSNEIFLIRLDFAGNLLWTQSYYFQGLMNGYQMCHTSDDGFAITGIFQTGGQATSEMLLLKTDASGNLQWSRYYGTSAQDEARSIVQTADGGYIITGITIPSGSLSYDVLVIRTDQSGTLLWYKSIGGTAMDWGFKALNTPHGGCVIGGISNSFGSVFYDFYLIKLAMSGTLEWSKTYGSSTTAEEARYVLATSDGGFLFCGNIVGGAFGSGDVYLVKTDSLGNSGCFESDPPTIATTIQCTNAFAALVTTSGNAFAVSPLPIESSNVQTTVLCTNVGLNQEEPLNSISVFPNPSNSEFTLLIDVGMNSGIELIVRDVAGRVVEKKNFAGETDQITFGLLLPGGFYTAELTTENQRKVVRLIKN